MTAVRPHPGPEVPPSRAEPTGRPLRSGEPARATAAARDAAAKAAADRCCRYSVRSRLPAAPRASSASAGLVVVIIGGRAAIVAGPASRCRGRPRSCRCPSSPRTYGRLRPRVPFLRSRFGISLSRCA
jgi:hypothetical protein